MRFTGRMLGWILIFVAVMTASAEAVVALGVGSYEGIVAADVWTLLLGSSPEFPDAPWYAGFVNMVMNWPAWTVIGPLGFVLSLMCRKKAQKNRMFF